MFDLDLHGKLLQKRERERERGGEKVKERKGVKGDKEALFVHVCLPVPVNEGKMVGNEGIELDLWRTLVKYVTWKAVV